MKTTLRIPIARLGRWYHPVYTNDRGEPVVEFTQADFDSIKAAFNSNDRGYAPYLTYGHVKRQYDKKTADGFPVEADLVNIQQVDDVLMGEFVPRNSDVVDNVRHNRYKFSSGEFVRNQPSKKTGETLRVYLKGVALTNTPFLPDLPENKVQQTSEDLNEVLLSESIELGEDVVISTQGDEQQMEQEQVVETSLENATEDVVQNIEDAKEVKTLLSELVSMAKSFFSLKEKETSEPAETLTEEEVPSQEETVIEETNVEDKMPELDLQAELAKAKAELEEKAAAEKAELEEILKGLKAEKAALEADKVALSDKVSSFEQDKIAAAQAAKEQSLTEKVELLVSAGLKPVLAQKVRALVNTASQETISLSEGADPVSLGDAVLDVIAEVLKPESQIEMDQTGASADTATLSDDADDPWAEFRNKYKQQRESK